MCVCVNVYMNKLTDCLYTYVKKRKEDNYLQNNEVGTFGMFLKCFMQLYMPVCL